MICGDQIVVIASLLFFKIPAFYCLQEIFTVSVVT